MIENTNSDKLCNIFEYIQTSKKEDLTTNILEFLLNQKYDESFSKVFCSLSGIHTTNFKMESQKSVPNGYIDLFLSSDNTKIVIENKFNSSFTNSEQHGHQIYKYASWLRNTFEGKTCWIIILTIKRRIVEVKTLLEKHCESSINSTCIVWEELLSESIKHVKDQRILYVLQSLNQYIASNFNIKNVALEKRSIEMIYSKEFAVSFDCLISLITEIKEKVADLQEQRCKIVLDTRFNCIGFEFLRRETKYWFGINSILWKERECPLYLEVVEKKEPDELYKARGFILDQYDNLIYEFPHGCILNSTLLWKEVLQLLAEDSSTQ